MRVVEHHPRIPRKGSMMNKLLRFTGIITILITLSGFATSYADSYMERIIVLFFGFMMGLMFFVMSHLRDRVESLEKQLENYQYERQKTADEEESIIQ